MINVLFGIFDPEDILTKDFHGILNFLKDISNWLLVLQKIKIKREEEKRIHKHNMINEPAVSAALANGEAVTSLQQAFQTIPYPGIGNYFW